jgi:hypothetical protein
MTKIYDGNFRIFIKWLEHMQRALHDQRVPYKSGYGGPIDIIGQAIGALHGLHREPPSPNVPASPHFQVNSQWIDFAAAELYRFNSMGDEYICSTVEAVIKCNGIKKAIDQYDEPLFYRGEHNFGWELISRLGRKMRVDWTLNDPCNVTEQEKKLLTEFQSRCSSDPETRDLVFGTSDPLPMNHPGWWSLMQHYDASSGTRMIDITSSLYCALFFACANWDGSVDSSVDGKLYMFPKQPGRGETDSPVRHKGILIGPDDQKQNTVDAYFTVEGNVDFPRFKVSPARNDRALSQDGFFVWQPYFDQPLKTFQIFPFRVHRDYKQSILQELSAMGYTQDRILAENRFGI